MNEDQLRGLRLLDKNKQTIATLKGCLSESEIENKALREDLVRSTIKIKKRKKLIGRGSRKKSARSFILCLTDNHVTQIVDPDLCNGNRHNEKIARSRISSVVSQFSEIVGDAERKYGIGESLIWLGGDSMVNADLHPHFRRLTNYEPLEELDIAFHLFRDCLSATLEGPVSAAPVRVHASLSNHGRDAKKEEVSSEIAYRRSYDVTIAKMLAGVIPIPFHIERSYFGQETVGGCSTLFHHGHKLTMKDHPSGLLLPNWSQLNRRLAQPKHAGTNLYVSGHYHTASHMVGNNFALVSAGSTVGQDGYSYELGYADRPPSQPLIEIAEGKVVHVYHVEP